MAYLIVHLVGSMLYILIEYVVGNTFACGSEHSQRLLPVPRPKVSVICATPVFSYDDASVVRVF